jgi:hypothetical protein
MPEETAEIKYPSSDRPKIIKSDERGAVCFTFDFVDSPLDDESVPALVSAMKTMLERLNPAYLFYEAEEEETEKAGEEKEGRKGPAVGKLCYKSPALDGSVYNVMFFIPFEGKTVMGTFSCPYDEHKEWRPVVFEILECIEISGEEEKTC